MVKQHFRRACAVLVLFVLSTLAFLSGLFDIPDYFLSDTVYTSYRAADPRIFVIGIDGDTLDRYGPWGSWSRGITADLIEYLNADESSKPAVIGVDILFSGNTTDREDTALAKAAENGGNVVLASQASFAKELIKTEQGNKWNYSNIQKYEEPFDELRAVSSSGLINIFTDSDGIVRRSMYEYDMNGKQLLSFSAQIAKIYSEKTGTPLPSAPPLDANGRWFIPFATKPGEYYGTGGNGTSWVRVMDGEIPRELFANSIVLIGPYSTGMLDNFYTSASRSSPMYGVEIHANAVQTLLEGSFKGLVPGYAAIITVFCISVFLYILFYRFNVRVSTLAAAAACVMYFIAAIILFNQGWLMPIFYPIMTVIIIYISLLITNYILLTLEKAGLYDRMQRLFVNSIRTIANAIDAKDPCTSGHCQRVSEYSLILGRDLHFSSKDLADLEYAALLHDVGKIGISDDILKKSGPLSNEEYSEMKKHPVRGAQILGTIQEFHTHITEGARYHHERYDGRGYCSGLSGEDIPLFGRIIAVADAYDAMTQNRPYHRRMSRDNAIEEIRRNLGTQFDPDLGERFIRLIALMPEPKEGYPKDQDLIDIEKQSS